MAKKRNRLRKNKSGFVSPRQFLENGYYLQLTFDEKVFVALTWLGFTNAEAWGVVNPMSEAAPNSKAVMAGRWACSHSVKAYIDMLNRMQSNKELGFKGFKGYNYDYDEDE